MSQTVTPNAATPPTGGVTVVIPTLNRGGFLGDCLRDLLAQTHRPLEILVVDQSETVPEEVAELARANPDVVSYHRVTFRGLPEARNFGWQNARHDAIVFVDDDIRCAPNLVAEHWRALNLPNVGLVAGGITEPNRAREPSPPVGTFNTWTATPYRGFAAYIEGDVQHAQGCNWSVWKHVIAKAGGLDERLNVGAALYEELELCLRVRKLGYRVYFNGFARLVHLVAATGGCRVDQVQPYVKALAHNRTMLIARHIPWEKKPVALGRLLLTGASFTKNYREPLALKACVEGIRGGVTDALAPVKCTRFGPEAWRAEQIG